MAGMTLIVPQKPSSYRAEIDGLRAIAVLAVVFYHLGFLECKGGFIGVDVFFVISGFLITEILLYSPTSGGWNNLTRFYYRRCCRIIPALFSMIIFCTVFVLIFFHPEAAREYGKGLLSVSLLSSNIFFCLTTQDLGYFAKSSDSNILLHTWSLSVEEQFYMVYPILFVLIRHHKIKIIAICIFLIASFVLNLLATSTWTPGAFYMPYARAWEFMIGGALALLSPSISTSTSTNQILSSLGLTMILYSIFTFSKNTIFPGTAALLPCLGSAFVIIGCRQSTNFVRSVLSCRLLVTIGTISYSLYLWHWPLIVATKYLDTRIINSFSRYIILIISIFIAYLSTRFIERPFRRRPPLFSQHKAFTASAFSFVIMCASGLWLVIGSGLPSRFDPRIRLLIEANAAQENEQTSLNCDNYRRPIKDQNDLSICRIGQKAKNILFWGDSHISSIEPLVERLFKANKLDDRGALFAVSSGCPIGLNLNRVLQGFYCVDFGRAVLHRALAPDVDTVFIAFSAWWDNPNPNLCQSGATLCTKILSQLEARDQFVRDLYVIMSKLRESGKRIILQLPEPSYLQSIPQAEINQLSLGWFGAWLRPEGIASYLERYDYEQLRNALLTIAKPFDVVFFDPRRVLCQKNTCILDRNQISIYTDSNHISFKEIEIYRAPLLSAIIQSRNF